MELLNLPLEILENIFDFLNNEDLLILIKSSKIIKDLLLLKIFRYKKLNIETCYLIYNIYRNTEIISKNICNYKI